MEATVVEAVMDAPVGTAMEPPAVPFSAVPSSRVARSSESKGEEGDEEETCDLLHDLLFPDGPWLRNPPWRHERGAPASPSYF